MLVGYMRVSTAEQNLVLQRDALAGAGCERVYDDTCSGSVTERPGLARALDALREGDALWPGSSTESAARSRTGHSRFGW